MEWKFQINWLSLIAEARQRRKKQNLTQRQLAVVAKVSTPTISRFESGEKDIQISTALRIFSVLGMVDHRQLVFQKMQKYDFSRDAVFFWGMDGNNKVQCVISKEALNDRFAEGNDLIKIFEANRDIIEHRASQKYLRNQIEKDGTVLLTTQDLL